MLNLWAGEALGYVYTIYVYNTRVIIKHEQSREPLAANNGATIARAKVRTLSFEHIMRVTKSFIAAFARRYQKLMSRGGVDKCVEKEGERV